MPSPELRDLSPILLGDSCSDEVGIEPETAQVDWVLRSAQGRRYLIAVNSKSEPTRELTFTVPGVTYCRPMFGDTKPIEVRDGRFLHKLEGHGRNIYELQ